MANSYKEMVDEAIEKFWSLPEEDKKKYYDSQESWLQDRMTLWDTRLRGRVAEWQTQRT